MANTPPALPEDFIQRLGMIVPPDRLEECIQSFCGAKPTTFRLNPLKASPEDTRRELEEAGFQLEPVPWYPEAFLLENTQRRALTESAAFYEGRIYIQNLSSMLAPLVLDPRPEEVVLDLAAAPGGKTLQIASMMNNRGQLSAVEAIKGRFFKLKANLERCGVTIAKTYLMDGRAVGKKCPQMFDRVLLDAPCSSEARFSLLAPESWEHWSLRKVKETSHKQKRLLESAIISLKSGGTLVYCTCSFSPEENEMIINSQLKKFGDAIEIQAISLPLDNVQQGLTRWGKKELHPDIARTVRILPNELMDGFYLCKLLKRGN